MVNDNANLHDKHSELASKVAVLEERSNQGQKQLEKIETMIVNHAQEEEQLLKNINSTLGEFRETIGEKIHDAVDPLKQEFIAHKAYVKGAAFILSVLWALITFAHDWIDKIFH